MRLPDTAHTTQPWRIHEIADDFRLEDVWALPTPGGPDDFEQLVRQFASEELFVGGLARALFAIRRTLGALLGLDRPEAGVGARTPSLRARLPVDLRDGPREPGGAFAPVYLADSEWLGERASKSVHALIHLGWVPDGAGGHRGQLAVLVKPHGLLGRAYLAGIRPLRRLVVQPEQVRAIARRWRSRHNSSPGPAHSPAIPQQKEGTHMITWTGRVIALFGAGHLALGLLSSLDYFGDWLSLRLWGHYMDHTPSANAFWGNLAGYGLPLLLIGLLVTWMDRRGIVPPAFLAWTVLAWASVCAVIVEPTPGPLLVITAILLLHGIRQANKTRRAHARTQRGVSLPTTPLGGPPSGNTEPPNA